MAEVIDLKNIDLTVYTAEELVSLSRRIDAEYQRKYTLDNIPSQIDEHIKRYQEAVGDPKIPGAEWVEPADPFDAYPSGAEVTWEGKTYISLVPANMKVPGGSPDSTGVVYWAEKH